MKLSKEQLETLRKEFRLSPRELQVLELTFEGIETSQELAERLGTTTGAVRAAARTLYIKTRARSKHGTLVKCLDRLGFRMGDPNQAIYAWPRPDRRPDAQ